MTVFFFSSMLVILVSLAIGYTWSDTDPYGFDLASKGHRGVVYYVLISLGFVGGLAGVIGSGLSIIWSWL